MRIVLLSGGSGKRLWPLSNEIRSKAFLKLLPSGEGGRESMIQRICGQLDQAGLLSYTSIVTHISQVEITRNHIGDQISILAEPHKRGTFMAVSLAASYFHSQLATAPDETICVIPVDAFVEAEFFQLLLQFPEILAQSGSDLALIGTHPNKPSSQYGYIVPQASSGKEYFQVSKFEEKPNEENAIRLINEGALWNCGVFAFPLSYMLSHMQNKALPLLYEELLNHYEGVTETSFDNEVVEKTMNCVAVPYPKAWHDLGDWSILPEYMGSRVVGLGQISSDSPHTHLINELMYPIHVIGVPNIIVAAGSDGILIASKDKASEIKKLLTDRQTPMHGEKRWGTYRVLDHSKTGIETLIKKVEILPEKNTSYHQHQKRREIWTILSGAGEFILEGVVHSIQAGDVLQIPSGAKHAVKAITSLEYVEIQIGNELLEEDIVRTAMTWQETLQYRNTNGEP